MNTIRRPLPVLHRAEAAGQFHEAGGAAGVVVGAVVDLARRAVGRRGCRTAAVADVVVVCRRSRPSRPPAARCLPARRRRSSPCTRSRSTVTSASAFQPLIANESRLQVLVDERLDVRRATYGAARRASRRSTSRLMEEHGELGRRRCRWRGWRTAAAGRAFAGRGRVVDDDDAGGLVGRGVLDLAWRTRRACCPRRRRRSCRTACRPSRRTAGCGGASRRSCPPRRAGVVVVLQVGGGDAVADEHEPARWPSLSG